MLTTRKKITEIGAPLLKKRRNFLLGGLNPVVLQKTE
jgi:hypothetical protein